MFKQPIRAIYCKGEDYKTCDHTEDKYMFLSIAQQKKGKVVNTLQSKFPPYAYYRMYKFLWKPYTQKIDDNVYMDKSALAKLKLPDNWEETRVKLHSS